MASIFHSPSAHTHHGAAAGTPVTRHPMHFLPQGTASFPSVHANASAHRNRPPTYEDVVANMDHFQVPPTLRSHAAQQVLAINSAAPSVSPLANRQSTMLDYLDDATPFVRASADQTGYIPKIDWGKVLTHGERKINEAIARASPTESRQKLAQRLQHIKRASRRPVWSATACDITNQRTILGSQYRGAQFPDSFLVSYAAPSFNVRGL